MKIELILQANQARIDERHQDAINYYFELLDENGDDVEIMRALARGYFHLYLDTPHLLNSAQEASRWINKAIELAPDKADLYITRGNFSLIGLGAPDYVSAAKDFKTALKLNPNLVDAIMGLANLEGVPEQVVSLSEAIKNMEYAQSIQPDNPYVYLALGVLYYKAGELHKAQYAHKRACLCSRPLAEDRIAYIKWCASNYDVLSKGA